MEPLKSKNATTLVAALERLWTRLGTRLPQHVQTDSGGEFYNAKVKAFFKKHGVNHFSTHGDPHGSVVERWNRTLKTKMFRYFTAKNTLNYIDVLPALVKTYNHSFHSSIEVQKHVGSARVAMNAKQERIKRVYPLLMRNDNRFFRAFLYLSMYQSTLASRNRKLSEDLEDSLKKLSLK